MSAAADKALPDVAEDAPQHMRALKRANEVRFEMAEAKKQIAAGEVDPADFFDSERFGNLTVAEVLTSQRRWGTTRARKFLNQHHLHNGRTNLESVKICDLTMRERHALRDAIVKVRVGQISNKSNHD